MDGSVGDRPALTARMIDTRTSIGHDDGESSVIRWSPESDGNPRDHEGKAHVKRIIRGSVIGAVLATAIGATAVAAVPAYADGATPTTLTVTGSQTGVTTGKPVSFTAAHTPTAVGKEKIGGSVAFTITGRDGSTVACGKVTPLTGAGKSRCMVAPGTLLAGSAPYTIVASYGGSPSGTFGPSSNSTTLSVTSARTRVKLSLGGKIFSGDATTVVAKILSGPADPLVSGTVVFTVTSQYHTNGVVVRCNGGSVPPTLNNIVTLTGHTATCDLPAGWMVIPKVSNANPKPSGTWSISAVYNGNDSFLPSYSTKKGTAKS